jgi:hypothetical protein
MRQAGGSTGGLGSLQEHWRKPRKERRIRVPGSGGNQNLVNGMCRACNQGVHGCESSMCKCLKCNHGIEV